MIVTYNKAEIVEDEDGKKFLHLELQAFMSDTKAIILSTFPATSNFDPLELSEASAQTEVLTIDKKQE